MIHWQIFMTGMLLTYKMSQNRLLLFTVLLFRLVMLSEGRDLLFCLSNWLGKNQVYFDSIWNSTLILADILFRYTTNSKSCIIDYRVHQCVCNRKLQKPVITSHEAMPDQLLIFCRVSNLMVHGRLIERTKHLLYFLSYSWYSVLTLIIQTLKSLQKLIQQDSWILSKKYD